MIKSGKPTKNIEAIYKENEVFIKGVRLINNLKETIND